MQYASIVWRSMFNNRQIQNANHQFQSIYPPTDPKQMAKYTTARHKTTAYIVQLRFPLLSVAGYTHMQHTLRTLSDRKIVKTPASAPSAEISNAEKINQSQNDRTQQQRAAANVLHPKRFRWHQTADGIRGTHVKGELGPFAQFMSDCNTKHCQ